MAESAEQAMNNAQNEKSGPSSSSQASAPTPLCANCSTPESSSSPEDSPNLKPCISCKSVSYCSRDCKKAHTKQHKKVCASLAQEYFRVNGVTMASRSAPGRSEGRRGGLQKWQFDT